MSTTFNIAEINKNIYLGKTKQIERPYADDPVRRYADPADLARHQRQWDQAKAWADEGAAIGEARRAKLDAARAEDAERRRLAARADPEADVKRRFMAQGHVDEGDWERLKGQKIDQALLEMPDPVEQAKAELRRSGRYPAL